MIPWINYFINALQIPQALSTGATTVTCAPEPITAEPTATPTLRNKQIYTCSGASWTGILPAVRSRSVHLNWLLWINETERVRAESVRVWGDPDTQRQQTVDVHVQLAASPPPPPSPPPESTNMPVRHVINLRWRSSKTQPPWVSVPTYVLELPCW